jgi:ABC-2 type transport system permease protein
VAILVIADPKQEFSEATKTKLKQYIERGGNLMINAEPLRNSPLQPLLAELGVQIMNGQLVQEDKDRSPIQVRPDFTDRAASLSKNIADIKNDTLSDKVGLSGAAGFTYTKNGPFAIEPLLMTAPGITWNRVKDIDPEIMTSASAGMVMTVGGPADTEPEAPAPPAKDGNSKTPAGKPAPPKSGTNTGAASAQTMADRKKKFDSIRTVMNDIRNGAGTEEEKQKKMKEVMEKLEKENPLTPAQKKTRDSVQTAMNAIINGPGTDEEKRRKVQELMMKMRQSQQTVAGASSGSANAVTATGPKTPAGNKPNPAAGAAEPAARLVAGGRRDYTGVVSFSPQDGDVKGPIAASLSLSRKVNGKEQRIVINGDADFMRNAAFSLVGSQFTTSLFSWLAYGEFPIDSYRPSREDNRVKVTTDQVGTLKLIFLWMLPAAIVAFAAILLIRRKRK